jgi:hypothetical protein
VDAPDKVREAAITNPVYLHPAGFHVSPAQTACTLHVPAGSRWVGGTIEFRRMSGGRIQIQKISPGIIRITLPANARIVLRKRGQPNANFSIALENAAVEKWISYLTSGRFRDDFPNLQQGVVPPEAFHLEELKKALAAFDYTLN